MYICPSSASVQHHSSRSFGRTHDCWVRRDPPDRQLIVSIAPFAVTAYYCGAKPVLTLVPPWLQPQIEVRFLWLQAGGVNYNPINRLLTKYLGMQRHILNGAEFSPQHEYR